MYLIDGNNLCGAARDRRLGMPTDPREMLARLTAFAAARRAFLTVVFDGAGGLRGTGRVRVIHSGAGRSADDRIVQLVGDHSRPADITLVSSDRDLRSRVRGLGARVMGCAEFAARMKTASLRRPDDPNDPDDPEEKPSPGDIEDWERYFTGEG